MNEFWRSIDEKPQKMDSDKVFFEFDDFLDQVASIFLVTLENSNKKSLIECFQKDFQAVDQDGNGIITKDELKRHT